MGIPADIQDAKASDRSRMQWWDVYVQVPEGVADAVSVYLQHLGSEGVVIYETTVLSPSQESCLCPGPQASGWTVLYGAWPADALLVPRLCALQQFLNTFPDDAAPAPWKLYCQPLRAHDYLTQWQRFFRPLALEERLLIRPPWENTPVPPTMASLILDPGQAFGTGLHPTTRLCLILLIQRLLRQQRGGLLDIGCGSGILSLAALKLGLDTAVGLDIDAQAIQVAAHNAALNALQDRVQFLQGSVETVTGQFAVITANIYLGPLVDMMPLLVQRLAPQGCMILAGILTHQEAALQAAMHTAGLEVERRREAEGWVALQGRHGRATGKHGVQV
jgi:ribosomal protein L11 methyltransferase